MPYYHNDNNFYKVQNTNNNFDWLIINYFYKSIINDKS